MHKDISKSLEDILSDMVENVAGLVNNLRGWLHIPSMTEEDKSLLHRIDAGAVVAQDMFISLRDEVKEK